MKSKNKILDGQHQAQNPLLSILIGTATRLEEALDTLDDFNRGPEGKTVISKELSQWVDGARAFVEEMAVAKLYEPMMLKVQRPIATNGPDKQLLIYNEDRSLQEQMVFDDPNLYSWFGDDYKMYVSARLWCNGQLQLIAREEDQPW